MLGFVVGSQSVWQTAAYGSLALVNASLLFLLTKCIYNLYFHPLRSYPGPFFARATRLYHAYYDVKGLGAWEVKKWHEKYGPVVRIAPDELSYADGRGWPEIYGQPRNGMGNFEKDPQYWNKSLNGVPNILDADDEGHKRMRRLHNPAFSDKALRSQEGIIKGYEELLLQRLRGLADNPKTASVNLVDWYTFITFDIIGDLGFGQPFHCLRDGVAHWWLDVVPQVFRDSVYLRAARRLFPPFSYAAMLMAIPKHLRKVRMDHWQYGVDQVNARLGETEDRPDFLSYILKVEGEKGISVEETHVCAQILIIAGSETSATTLVAASYFLTEKPELLAKLNEEIEGRFNSEDEITIQSTADLPYLNAVMQESLRLCPAAPSIFPRRVPEGGRVVCDKFVPGGYTVGVHQLATNLSKENFVDPESFIPERWLGDARYEKDNRAACQPFSYGPRNCLGKNLAYAEIKTILSRMVWNFDMKLDPASQGWPSKQKSYTAWEKEPMNVILSRKTRD